MTVSKATPASNSKTAPARKRASLEGWSVSRRVQTGFGVVLTLMAAVGVVAFLAVGQLSTIFDGLRGSTRQTAFIGQIAADLASAQIAMREYQATPSEEAAATARDLLAHVQAAPADIEQLFGDEPAIQSRLKGLNESARALAAAFEKATELQATRDAEYETLRALTEEIRKSMNGLVFSANMSGDSNAPREVARGKELFLDGRYAASAFVMTGAEKSLEDAQLRLRESRSTYDTMALRVSGGLKDSTKALIGKLEEWSGVLTRLSEVTAEQSALAEQALGPLAAQVMNGYVTLRQQVIDKQRALGPAGAANIDVTKTTLLAGVALALGVGIALALLVGRWISRSIRRLADGMGRLANGDLEISVEGGEHKHELGAMARAVAVFKDNAIEMKRLDAEKAASDARAAEERRAMMNELGRAFGAVVDAAVEGDFSSRVADSFPDPELNALARGLNRLLETTEQGLDEVGQVMGSVAQGDLSRRMAGAFSGAFAALQRDVNVTVDHLAELIADLQSSASTISRDSSEIADAAADLSSRAESQAASLEETAATMEEMTATINANADTAASAAGLARDASVAADHGGKVVNETVDAIRRIEASSTKITEIIGVIDGIAFQTNLLALNAAVEAARAGDAGKGFAVVAQEVRTLAQRSAEAAQDVKTLVTESAGHVGAGVQSVEQAGKSLEEIVAAIRKVSESVEDISSASGEQAQGVREVTASVSEMDGITQRNTALAEQSAGAARRLAQESAKLGELISGYTTGGASASERSAA